VDEAGLAGGLQAVAIQLGGVLGSSIIGSVLAARVTALLPHGFPLPTQVVAQGAVPAGTPPAVAATAHAAFLSGLHVALLFGALATLIGAACGPFVKAELGESSEPASVII
jgi:hypothetical protein